MNNEKQGRLNALRQLLDRTKDAAARYADGIMTAEDYDETRKQRQAWQEELTMLEAERDGDSSDVVLGKLIALKVASTRAELDAWLAQNPLESSVHGGKPARYSVTSEKQSLLTSTLLMAQGAFANDLTYDITWNATGQPCEAWTFDELSYLAYEIAAYVKPLVSHQQHLEVLLKGCTTIEELNAVAIDYSGVSA